MRKLAIALLCLLPVIAEAAPPPALPAMMLSRLERTEIFTGHEDFLSQFLKKHVDLIYIRLFTEQDGGDTECSLAIVDGKNFRLVDPAHGDLILQPTDQQWIDAGCERPEFTFLG